MNTLAYENFPTRARVVGLKNYSYELGRRVPLIRDPGDDFYSRQEHHGLLVGIYEQGCKTWGRDHIPVDFANKLGPPDLEPMFDPTHARPRVDA